MTNKEIKEFLKENADHKLAHFSSSLIPGVQNMVGVRIPVLRALAKKIASQDWRNYLSMATEDSFEETMLQGLVIGTARMDIEEALNWMASFVPKINNWALCDSPSTGFKIAKKHRPDTWIFLQRYLRSGLEFEQRFGVVMLLAHFLVDDYIDRVLELLNKQNPTAYYSRMAVAWALATCFVKYPEKTWPYLEHSALDADTICKTLQKIQESLRTPVAYRDRIRALKLLVAQCVFSPVISK